MPTQEELDAQNNSFQAQQPYVNPFMQPDVNPFMQPYNIGSVQLPAVQTPHCSGKSYSGFSTTF